MQIRIDVLQYLQRVIVTTPLHTPKRLGLITQRIKEYCSNYTESHSNVILPINGAPSEFVPTEDVITFLVNKLPRCFFPRERLNFGGEIFMPPETSCCKGYRINPRGSSVQVYDIDGLYEAINFHGHCSQCKRTFHSCYVERVDCVHEFREKYDVFQVTYGIAFTARFLRHISLQVTTGLTSFEKIADIYNQEMGWTSRLLEAGVVQDTWLLYRITQYTPHVTWHRKSNSHINVEKYALKAILSSEEWSMIDGCHTNAKK